jgi:hypothetical protein
VHLYIAATLCIALAVFGYLTSRHVAADRHLAYIAKLRFCLIFRLLSDANVSVAAGISKAIEIRDIVAAAYDAHVL